MNLFTMNLDQAGYSHIEEFCKQNFSESVRLDYKRELSSNEPRDQVVKGVSAFANTLGGILLFGVGTKGSRFPDWPSEGMPTGPDFEKQTLRLSAPVIEVPRTPI